MDGQRMSSINGLLLYNTGALSPKYTFVNVTWQNRCLQYPGVGMQTWYGKLVKHIAEQSSEKASLRALPSSQLAINIGLTILLRGAVRS